MFILFFNRKSSGGLTGVLVSILLGLYSFAMSIKHALHAKASDVDKVKVETKINERKMLKDKEYIEKANRE